MISVQLDQSFEDWRKKARVLLARKIHFDDIEWITESNGFQFGDNLEMPSDIPPLAIPKTFMDEAYVVSAFRDHKIWPLLYRLAYRQLFENKKLMELSIDPDVMDFQAKYRLVTRDIHKMKAFVRFKEVKTEESTLYLAWHRPDHRIVRLAANFFKERFNGMNWMIMTDDETVSWDQNELTFSPGVPKEKAQFDDSTEELWKTYYGSIFNPARIKITAMKKELPVRHWKTLPETELITSLIDEAPARLKAFYDSQKVSAINHQSFETLSDVSEALAKCRACGICEKATAPVMGEGPQNARIMIVGEQPGDEEDLKGKPFIGPAGQLLNEAMKKVNLPRSEIYVTNAVKGFKHIITQNGRWHRNPNGAEISQCRPWLKEEVKIVKPDILVCLGRSAAQSVVGKMIKLEEVRGKFFQSTFAKQTIILPHPASILRSEEHLQQDLFQRFTSELKLII